MNAVAKKSKLTGVTPKSAAPSRAKTLLFGKPGVGKTWGALDFPSVYYIDCEGGADLEHYTDKLAAAGGMYFGPEQGSLDFAAVIGQLQALATEQHHYRTVVIDSISKLFSVAIADEAERILSKGNKDEFGASKKPAVAMMRRLVAWISRLDMNVLLIAHEVAEWGLDDKGQRAQVGFTFDAWDRLEYELHLCLRISKEGQGRYATVRKTRLVGFPDASRFPWSYSEFASRYGQDVIEADSTPLDMANPIDVAEIERLLTIVKMPEGWIEKALAKANADSFAEMSSEHAGKVIAFLNDRLKGIAA